MSNKLCIALISGLRKLTSPQHLLMYSIWYIQEVGSLFDVRLSIAVLIKRIQLFIASF